MIPATWKTSLCRSLLLVCGVPCGASGQDSLLIDADAPVVTVREQKPGRSALRLPTLEYRLNIRTVCAEERAPSSLSLNVADTRRTLRETEILVDRATEVTLTIPAAQIPPVVIDNFCIAPDAGSQEQAAGLAQSLQIPAALSLQASLLCARDENRVMTYMSQALDVALVCERAVLPE